MRSHLASWGVRFIRIIKKIAVFIIALVLVQVMNLVLISFGDNLSNLINTNDPRKGVLILIVQELLQLGAAILIFKVLFKRNINQLGFNLKNKKLSLKIFAIFCIVWLLVIVTYYIIAFIFDKSLWHSLLHSPLPSKDYAIAYIGFEAIFPGLCEETLFRGLILYTLLSYGWANGIKLGKIKISYGAILTGIIFMCAHIYYEILPFEITHLNYTQLLMAFSLGIFQAMTYEKTGSLLSPILAHNFSNVSSTLCGYLLSFIGGLL